MKDQTFKVGDDVDLHGTFRVGSLRASEEALIAMFGPSNPPSGDGKVCLSWSIEFEDGVVANIHDWKGHANPWSIGGRDARAVKALQDLGLDAQDYEL